MADTQSSLLSAPNEILMQYLLPLDAESLQNACRSFKLFSDICKDDYFWYMKVERDFGMIDKKDTWKNTWIKASKEKTYEFVYNYSIYRYDERGLLDEDERIMVELPNREFSQSEVEMLYQYFTEFITESDILYRSLELTDVIVESNSRRMTFKFIEKDKSVKVTPERLKEELNYLLGEYLEEQIGAPIIAMLNTESLQVIAGPSFDLDSLSLYVTKFGKRTLIH